MFGKRLKDHIHKEAEKIVDVKSLDFFIEDVFEDLKYLDQSRIVGFGVTSDELQEWMLAQRE